MQSKAVKIITALAGAILLTLLILYTGGFFTTGKIGVDLGPDRQPPARAQAVYAKAKVAFWPQYHLAVGTVRPHSEIQVSAQVNGRVVEVKVRPGDEVKKRQLLLLLDDKQNRARLGQAKQGAAAARAALERAEKEYKRVAKYLAGQAATQRDLERAKEARLTAAAKVRQAARQVEEAEIALSYSRVKSPESGRIVKRLVEPGDLALPGRPLILMQTKAALLLEARVREGLITRVAAGQQMKVEIPALKRDFMSLITEITPSADPMTRTFLVKAALPKDPALHSGMFGRLLVPESKRRVVLAPQESVRRVGQLEMVTVIRNSRPVKVYVTTGRVRGDEVEILSGLSGGERLLVSGGGDA